MLQLSSFQRRHIGLGALMCALLLACSWSLATSLFGVRRGSVHSLVGGSAAAGIADASARSGLVEMSLLLAMLCVGTGLLASWLVSLLKMRVPPTEPLEQCRDNFLTPDSLAASYGSVVLDMIGSGTAAAQLAACSRCCHGVVLDTLEPMDSALHKAKQQRRVMLGCVPDAAAMSATNAAESSCITALVEHVKESAPCTSAVMTDSRVGALSNRPTQDFVGGLRSADLSRRALKVRFAEAIEVVQFIVEPSSAISDIARNEDVAPQFIVEQLDIDIDCDGCFGAASSPESCGHRLAAESESHQAETIPATSANLRGETGVEEKQFRVNREAVCPDAVASVSKPVCCGEKPMFGTVPATKMSAEPGAEVAAQLTTPCAGWEGGQTASVSCCADDIQPVRKFTHRRARSSCAWAPAAVAIAEPEVQSAQRDEGSAVTARSDVEEQIACVRNCADAIPPIRKFTHRRGRSGCGWAPPAELEIQAVHGAEASAVSASTLSLLPSAVNVAEHSDQAAAVVSLSKDEIEIDQAPRIHTASRVEQSDMGLARTLCGAPSWPWHSEHSIGATTHRTALATPAPSKLAAFKKAVEQRASARQGPQTLVDMRSRLAALRVQRS
eukprot:TRINITY_DN8088_c0_g1_i1.p1 TRINITY_DN8088_c0_g1~~TRINITY_DN8088_c0_g1_i1.p1  ORF type:complete len:613 (-),score=97.67 TRINITY_DN8088_c0_g1_i1:36-1874(-)